MKNKKILGLDIGTTSIGWAIVEAKPDKPQKEQYKDYIAKEAVSDINNDRVGIHIKDGKAAVGVRIIKQDTDSIQQFNIGKKLNDGKKATPTALRRQKRGSRRLKSRYKLRRLKLHQVLDVLGMLPEGITKNISKDGIATYTQDKNSKYYTAQKGKRNSDDIGRAIYELRDKAIKEKITLTETGRILLHLNQWRGYSSDRFSVEEKQTFDYYTGEIISIGIENKTPVYNKDNKEKRMPDSYKAAIKIKLFEAINVSTDTETPEWKDEFEGFIFKKEFKIKVGEIITIKEPEWKQLKESKKIVEEYYEIKQTFPNPEDWGFRYQTLQKNLTDYCKNGGTVGSYFYQNFYVNKAIDRIRTNIVNRDWYEKEFDKIFELQYENHKSHFGKFTIEHIVAAAFKPTYKDGKTNPAYQQIINEVQKSAKENAAKSGKSLEFEQLKYLIKDVIIYYQRPWQQAKNKGECKFEFISDVKPNPEYKEGISDKKDKWIPNLKATKIVTDKEGKKYYLKGRTVIPRSHPLHQEFKIWNQINNVKLNYHQKDNKPINLFEDEDKFLEKTGRSITDVKALLFNKLQNTKSTTWYSFVRNELKLDNVCDELEELTARRKFKSSKKIAVNTETGEVFENYFTVNFRKRKKDGSYDDIKLKGNTTLVSINNILNLENGEWYNKSWKTSNDKHKEGVKPNVAKGEFKNCEYKITNLQLLWETIYDISISKKEKVAELLQKHFPDFTTEQCNQLSIIKFDDTGMAQLSAKAIRNLLPLMSNGLGYTQKAEKQISKLIKLNDDEKDFENENKLLGVKDFFKDAKTRLELAKKTTKDSFKYLTYTEASAVRYGSHSSKGIKGNFKAVEEVRQHSMNNPVVEKIVNETIRVVNDIYETYGFDEVRIELSRELKASADERQQMSDMRDKNTEKNEWAKEMLRELFNADKRDITKLDISIGGSNIDKIKIMDDVANEHYNNLLKSKRELSDKQKQPTKSEIEKYLLWIEQMHRCPYTNEIIPLTDVFHKDKIVEIEHIIPRERFPNNSFSNKVITWSAVNKDKADLGNRTSYEYIVSKRNTAQSTIKLSEQSAKPNKLVNLVKADEWLTHVELLFPKGAKRNNLLRKEIPQEPLERELKDTQYINKKLKEKLAEIVGSDKVHTTTGQVTDILRESWHLNEVMKEITKERFANFKITKLKPEFEISAAQLQSQLESIEELLENETEVKEFKVLKSAEVSINIDGKELINEIKNKLDDFIANTKKITKNSAFQITLNEIVYEVTGEKLIEEAKINLKKAVEEDEINSKIILQHEESFITNDIDEIQTIKEQLEEQIKENEKEGGKAKPFKYCRKTEVNLISNNPENQKHTEQFNGYSKRIDHRHHALDAIIIACTKQNHIQYLNNMNAINSADQESDSEKAEKYKALKEDVCRKSNEGDLQANKFNYPWYGYNKTQISNHLEEIIIANKNINVLISPSKNKNIKDETKQNAISIRGNLHKETIYGKRKFVDLSEKGKVKISALVTKILKQKAESQNQNDFKTIIEDLIFKEKYQLIMYSLFDKYNDVKLCLKEIGNDDFVPINEVSKEINKVLKTNTPFANKKGEKLTWLRVYQSKDKAVRPNGHAMNFNKVKDGIKDIADPRIYRIANYRLNYVNQKIKDIENSSLSKDDKEIEKNKILQLPLYSNAIYDVKVKNQNGVYEWIEIKNLRQEQLDKIDFGNEDKNKKVKAKINEMGLDNLKKDYFTNPIYISSKLIPVKKTREKAFYKDLVEIKPKQFVYSEASYLCFILKGSNKREPLMLKFLEAVKSIDKNKGKLNPIEIALKNGIDKSRIEFTLQSGDIVYLPSKNSDTPFDIQKIDMPNIKSLIPNLFVVKDMNPSQNKIVFAKINTASAIELNKKDVSSIFAGIYSKDFTEEIKYGTVGMLQDCIKVYTNRLGSKIVPYTMFENGIWNKERAKDLGLILKEEKVQNKI